MSKCMTIDETIDQKEIYADINAKDIIQFILEEVVGTALGLSDKDCGRIGDFNITEDFCQQFDQTPAYQRELETSKFNSSQNSLANQDLKLDSGENIDRSVSLITAKENLEFVLDSLSKKDEKTVKNYITNECKIISEDVLANNELRIENGQIRIEKNEPDGFNQSYLNSDRVEFFDREDVIKDEKIEIAYFNEGKLNKIYVSYVPLEQKTSNGTSLPEPLLPTSDQEAGCIKKNVQHLIKNESEVKENNSDSPEKGFTPCTTEDLRQVWENANSPIVEGWDEFVQSEGIIRLMEELSSVQVYSDASADPNRPRAYAFAEEDVRKMTKEIEEINFNQGQANLDEFATSCHSDGKGDAILESKSKHNDNSFSNQKNKSDISIEDTFSHLPNALSGNENFGRFPWNLVEKNDVPPKIKLMADETRPDDIKKQLSVFNASDITSKNKKYQAHETSHEVSSLDDEGLERHNLQSQINFGGIHDELKRQSSQTDISLSVERGDYLSEIEESFVYLEMTDTKTQSNPVNCEEASRLTTVQKKYSEENIRLRNTLGNIFHENEADLLTSRNYLSTSTEKTASTGSLPPAKSAELEKDSISSMATNANTLRNRERELDSALRELKLNSEKGLYNLKGSQSVNNAVDNVQAEQGTSESDKTRKESFNDASMSWEKVIEVSSPESSSMFVNEEKQFKTGTDFVLPQVSLFSNKSEDEIAEIEKINYINYDVSCECSFSDSGKIDRKNSLEKTLTKYLHQSFEEEINGNSYSTRTKKEEYETKSPSQADFKREVRKSNEGFETLNEKEESHSNQKLEHKQECCHPFTDACKHSQKMYGGVDFDPVSSDENGLTLTTSEEALIDMTENIIQIIDPAENSTDEDSNPISFSLLDEKKEKGSSDYQKYDDNDAAATMEPGSFTFDNSEEQNALKKKIYSGMTTIGPLKNCDYDSKDLTAPDIDFGKMTRITSSRQLEKDLFRSEFGSSPSLKIIDGSDEDIPMNAPRERMEVETLINRDIASLTKVQKVREVMSYHPKSDEEFEDDNNLNRPRLDLKDVESMTDERYKVPDVNIPLLSFEVGNNSSDVDKELIQTMHLVLSGNCFDTNNRFDEDSLEEGNSRLELNGKKLESDASEEVIQKSKPTPCDSRSQVKNLNEFSEAERGSAEPMSDLESCGALAQQKYGTLRNAFKKASNKFIHKDSDRSLRNSKSLPRDPKKVTATDSIKSMLEDCHSSASAMLKKSRSIFKNTQTVLKSVSQNRFVTLGRTTSIEKQKISPSESNISEVGRRFSFIKKDDLVRAKNLVKSKMEMTFKSTESFIRGSTSFSKSLSSSAKSETGPLSEKSNFSVNERENGAENNVNILTKGPLIYKSQFVRSQISVQGGSSENIDFDMLTDDTIINDEWKKTRSFTVLANEKILSQDQVPSQPVVTDVNDKQKVDFTNKETGKEASDRQPEFIVMETVQGLPIADLKFPSIEAEKYNDPAAVRAINFQDIKECTDDICIRKKSELLTSPQTETPLEQPDEDSVGNKLKGTAAVDKKFRTKKKFTARFRSFWYSTFGRVKTSTNKRENSK